MIRDKQSGRSLTFTIKPEFARSMSNLPLDRLEGEGRRAAAMPERCHLSASCRHENEGRPMRGFLACILLRPVD